MKEYIERAAAEQVIAAIMPSMSTPDGAGANDEMVFAAQEMCADALSAVHRLPAADVAEVVRCAQCKHARESKDAFDWDGKTPLCECAYMTQPNRWHEYCSWGKRKEDEHEAR